MKKNEVVLENGMRVILVEKPDFVQSFAMISIPAGGTSRIEDRDGKILNHRSGVAHFLEHQMFYLDGEDVTERLSEEGANSNAYTSLDKTAYYIWTDQKPEEAVKVLMDFVQNLDIDDKTINKEKGIILSEYGMYDQQPESRIYKEGLRSLYHNHPIRDDILGSIEDIKAMDEQDLRDFYQSFYDPGKLVLTLVSSQPAEKSLEMIREYEKKYPSTAAPAKVLYPEEPETVAREYFEDKMDVLIPYCLFAIKLKVPKDMEKAYQLDLIANIWLEYFFSSMNPEYTSWIDQGIITQSLSAQAEYSTDYAYLQIFTQSAQPEAFFELCQKLFAQRPMIPEPAFKALKNSEIGSVIRSMDQFETLANDLAECLLDGVSYEKMADLSKHLTAEDIRKWVSETNFSSQSRLVIWPNDKNK